MCENRFLSRQRVINRIRKFRVINLESGHRFNNYHGIYTIPTVVMVVGVCETIDGYAETRVPTYLHGPGGLTTITIRRGSTALSGTVR